MDLGDIKPKAKDTFPKGLEERIAIPDDGYMGLQDRVRNC